MTVSYRDLSLDTSLSSSRIPPNQVITAGAINKVSIFKERGREGEREGEGGGVRRLRLYERNAHTAEFRRGEG